MGTFFSLSPSLRELVKLQREVMTAETALEQKRLARHNLLLACKIQSLPITLLSGSLNEISQVQVGRGEVHKSLLTVDCFLSLLNCHFNTSQGNVLDINLSSNYHIFGNLIKEAVETLTLE